QLAQTLILIAGLNRDAIVETVELAGQRRDGLGGLLQFGVEFLDQRCDGFRQTLAHRRGDGGDTRPDLFTRERKLFAQFVAGRTELIAQAAVPFGPALRQLLRDRFADALAGVVRVLLELSMERADLFAQLDAGGAEHLAQPDHLRAEVRASRGVSFTIFGDPIRNKADLTADLGELSDHFGLEFLETS